jgi:hypothetical protein
MGESQLLEGAMSVFLFQSSSGQTLHLPDRMRLFSSRLKLKYIYFFFGDNVKFRKVPGKIFSLVTIIHI